MIVTILGKASAVIWLLFLFCLIIGLIIAHGDGDNVEKAISKIAKDLALLFILGMLSLVAIGIAWIIIL